MSILQVSILLLVIYLKIIFIYRISYFFFKAYRIERELDGKSYFGDDYTLDQIEAVFDCNGIDAATEMKRASLLRWSAAEIDVNSFRSLPLFFLVNFII